MKPHLVSLYFLLLVFLSGSGLQGASLSIVQSSAEGKGNFIWAKAMGGNFIVAMDRDKNDNLYSIGTFNNTRSFDSITNLTSSGGNDIFISKHSSAGHLIWVRQIKGINTETAKSLTVSKNGIYICGVGRGNIDFGNNITLNIDDQHFIARYTTDGLIEWVQTVNAPKSKMNFSINAMVTDSLGNIVLAGLLSDSASVFNTMTYANSNDIFIAKLDPNANLKWIKTEGGNNYDNLVGISIGVNNDVYSAVEFSQSTRFGGIQSETVQSGFLISKHSQEGVFQWMRTCHASNGRLWTLGVDKNDNVTFGGDFNGEINFENGDRFVAGFGGYLVQYTNAGRLRWTNHIRCDKSSVNLLSLTADTNSNVYGYGTMDNEVQFGNGVKTSAGSGIFIVMYDSAGRAQWSDEVISYNFLTSGSYARIFHDNQKSFYLTGNFRNTVSFNKELSLKSTEKEIFLTRYNIDRSITVRDTVIQSEQITITYPNGGETLIAGSTVEIRWKGVSTTEKVKLLYSDDNGKSWYKITENATQFHYTWKVPSKIGIQYMIKAIPNSNKSASYKAQTGFNIGSSSNDQVVTVTSDSIGNIYLLGMFGGRTIDFGNNVKLENIFTTSENYCIVKYDKDFKAQWTKYIPHKNVQSENHSFNTMSVDRDGNIYVGGIFNDTVNYEGTTVISRGTHDISILKYNNDGLLQWVRTISGIEYSENIYKIINDNEGNIYACGIYSAETDFGSGIIATPINSLDMFLVKFDENGVTQWVRSAGSNKMDFATDMALDKNGNIVVCGASRGNMKFDSIETQHSYNDKFELFLAKFNTEGDIQWARSAKGSGAANYENSYREHANICIDSQDNIYVGGSADGTGIEFSDNVKITGTMGNRDIYLVKYSSEGIPRWATSTFNYYNDAITSVACQSDKIYTGGYIHLDASFAEYDTNGILTWTDNTAGQNPVSNTTVRPNSICITRDGSLVTGGYFNGTPDFKNNVRVNSAGSYDMFIVQYSNTGDISDSTFSVVRPQLTYIREIDMGRIKVSESKDSIITSCIRNPNTFAVSIDSLSISAGNTEDFAILSSTNSTILQANEEKEITLRFTPSTSGVRQSQLHVHVQGNNKDIIPVRGEGIDENFKLILFPIHPMPANGEVEIAFE